MGIFTPILGGVYTITHWDRDPRHAVLRGISTGLVTAATIAATQYEEIVGVAVLIFYLTGPLYVPDFLRRPSSRSSPKRRRWHVTRRASTSPKATAASQVEQPLPVCSSPFPAAPAAAARRRRAAADARAVGEDLTARSADRPDPVGAADGGVARPDRARAVDRDEPFGTHRFNQLEEDLDYRRPRRHARSTRGDRPWRRPTRAARPSERVRFREHL